MLTAIDTHFVSARSHSAMTSIDNMLAYLTNKIALVVTHFLIEVTTSKHQTKEFASAPVTLQRKTQRRLRKLRVISEWQSCKSLR